MAKSAEDTASREAVVNVDVAVEVVVTVEPGVVTVNVVLGEAVKVEEVFTEIAVRMAKMMVVFTMTSKKQRKAIMHHTEDKVAVEEVSGDREEPEVVAVNTEAEEDQDIQAAEATEEAIQMSIKMKLNTNLRTMMMKKAVKKNTCSTKKRSISSMRKYSSIKTN